MNTVRAKLSRAWRSLSIKVYSTITMLSGSFMMLDAVTQVQLIEFIRPYAPPGEVVTFMFGILGILLRAKTTKSLLER